MNLFGTDKPDLRVPERIRKVSEVFANSTFKVFQNALAQGGDIYTISYSVDKIPPRKYFDDLIEWYQKLTGNGVAYLIRENGETRGNISKFVSEEELKSLALPESSVAFFVAGTNVLQGFGKLRVKVSEDLGTIKRDQFCFCWITDYPMYELVDGKIDFSHNPFSMPQGGLEALNSKDPLEIKAYQYDVVCNGHELSSGAIRNHDPEIMYRAFEIVGYSREEVESQFGGIIRAFKFGAPPHGGMAPGVDRMVMLLAGKEAVRDVIAFPLAQSVEDLMMNAPSEVSEKHLKELGIKIM
jgi:aspartyl-tRNA synthetase